MDDCRGALDNEPNKSDAASIDLGGSILSEDYDRVVSEEGEKLEELISSIRKIEEYLIVRDIEKPVQDGWLFATGGSSFYYWLKETYRRRSLRSKYFNEYYFSGGAAWNILLDLAASKIEGRRISVTSACLASKVPPTTALRWIGLLEEDGMIVKENDLSDRRRTFLQISDQAMRLIYTYYNDLHSHSKIKRRSFAK
jgi:hypothetical protein